MARLSEGPQRLEFPVAVWEPLQTRQECRSNWTYWQLWTGVGWPATDYVGEVPHHLGIHHTGIGLGLSSAGVADSLQRAHRGSVVELVVGEHRDCRRLVRIGWTNVARYRHLETVLIEWAKMQTQQADSHHPQPAMASASQSVAPQRAQTF